MMMNEWITCVFVLFLPYEIRSRAIWYTKSPCMDGLNFFFVIYRMVDNAPIYPQKWHLMEKVKRSIRWYELLSFVPFQSPLKMTIDTHFTLFSSHNNTTLLAAGDSFATLNWHCFLSVFEWNLFYRFHFQIADHFLGLLCIYYCLYRSAAELLHTKFNMNFSIIFLSFFFHFFPSNAWVHSVEIFVYTIIGTVCFTIMVCWKWTDAFENYWNIKISQTFIWQKKRQKYSRNKKKPINFCSYQN